VKPKIANFPAISQANARTGRWPWLCLGFLVELVKLIIGWLFHLAPIPAAQNTAPTRKPLRVFSFWKLRTGGFAVFACALILALSQGVAAGEWMRRGMVSSPITAPILLDTKKQHEQSQQQNANSEERHGLRLGRVVKTERIWLWARVWTLCSPAGSGAQAESWNYDLLGNVVSHIDRNGVAEGFGFDAESRLLASSRASVATAQRTLDAVGNTITITDARNNTTRTKYDLANRVIEVTAANGDITKTTYDQVGNVLTKTDGTGRITTNVYDKRSRKISETNFAGEVTIYTYDGVGNLLTTKKPIGTWTYTFDDADRLETVLTPRAHLTQYEYDKNNNRTVAKNANLHALTMAYNARNQLESLTYPNSEAESYRYDANDNRIGRTDANGTVTANSKVP